MAKFNIDDYTLEEIGLIYWMRAKGITPQQGIEIVKQLARERAAKQECEPEPDADAEAHRWN